MLTVEVQNEDLVWGIGKILDKNDEWQEFEFEGDKVTDPEGNVWIKGEASNITEILPDYFSPDVDNTVLAYACSFDGEWDCHGGFWMAHEWYLEGCQVDADCAGGLCIDNTCVDFAAAPEAVGEAELSPMGDEFQVNTYTQSSQEDPSVSSLSDGGFVVTWTWISYGQDGSGPGIFGQRYDAGGEAVGNEFQVNTYTEDNQSTSSVSGLSDGGFVVTWDSNPGWQGVGQDGSYSGIYGQRYDAGGEAVGNEFQVNTYTDSHQQNPSVSGLSDGGFVVTWQSYGQDGSSLGVYGQLYDAGGEAVGNEFQVNTYTDSYQENPSVSGLSDGGFVVTWESWGQDEPDGWDYYGIFVQRYDADGEAVGNEFQVNTYTQSSQRNPSVSGLSDGGFIVTWQSWGQDEPDGWGAGIYGQLYDAGGEAVGNEFQVNTYTENKQKNPSVSGLSDGGFVVTWESWGQDEPDCWYCYGIFVQLYDAGGEAVGNEFQVNTYTQSSQKNPSVSGLSDGGFVVTWESYGQDGSYSGIYGQLYDAGGHQYVKYHYISLRDHG